MSESSLCTASREQKPYINQIILCRFCPPTPSLPLVSFQKEGCIERVSRNKDADRLAVPTNVCPS